MCKQQAETHLKDYARHEGELPVVMTLAPLANFLSSILSN